MTTSSICNILKLALEFQMDDLVTCCCKILEQKIDLDSIKEITCTAGTVVSLERIDNDGGEQILFVSSYTKIQVIKLLF